jgi:GC-rich sequence DNA-binding factor
LLNNINSRLQYPLLEKLEEEHLSLFKERRDMLAKRRDQDDADDLSIFLGLQTSTISDESEPKLDEFGRSIPVDAASERRERRLERLDRRKRRATRQTVVEEEGYSTDSSLAPTDLSAYGEAVQSIAASSKEVLADVKAAEFRDPAKGRWAVWREKYADSYVGAWGGLGVVSVWEFWVRLECVNWDCIEVSSHPTQPERHGQTDSPTRVLGVFIASSGIKVSMNIRGQAMKVLLRREALGPTETWWPPWSPQQSSL